MVGEIGVMKKELLRIDVMQSECPRCINSSDQRNDKHPEESTRIQYK